jgi:hypothetical protein
VGRSAFPLFKVQRPLRTNEPKPLWRIYTKRMKAAGEFLDIPVDLVPERLKEAMGRDYIVFVYLNIETEDTCDCEGGSLHERCTHPVLYHITYEGKESSSKKTQW